MTINDYAPVVRRKRGKGPRGKRELNRIRAQQRTRAEQEAIASRRARRNTATPPALDVETDLL